MLTSLIFIVVSLFRLAKPELTGFYYDQGRDALVIWDLIQNGKLFLIGPTTGVEGIFLGPGFYYLLAPWYWLGGGNPVWPIQFLAVLNIVGLFLLYKLGEKYFSRGSGLLAMIFAGFSYHNLMANRWLINPNPLTLTSIIIFALLVKLIQGEKKWFALICFLIGLGLHFEAASAIFFLPAILVILIVFLRTIKMDFKNLFLGGLAFGLTLIPQLWFNFRHENILFKAFQNFVVDSPPAIVQSRLEFYFDTFTKHFTLASFELRWLMVLILIIGLVKGSSILFKNDIFKLGLIWIMTPVIALLLYTGNNGYVWGYYFTGIFPVIYLLVGAIFATFLRYKYGKLMLIIVVSIIVHSNLWAIKYYFFEDTGAITLGRTLAVVDWIAKDAGNQPFNVDVYVPPVIPYAYDYLFKWRNIQISNKNVELLYTPYEPDGPHPERLKMWLARQDGIGKLESETKLGPITIQKRTRKLWL